MTRRKAGGRPTKAEAEAIHFRLLDGARSIFCRKGIANTSLDEIAVVLGVSKHTIYRRYSNKHALLEAVVERDLLRFREALALAAAAKEANSPLDAIHGVAWRYFEFGSSRDYAAFYLSVSAEAAFSSVLRERLADWARTALEPLVAALSAAQTAGILGTRDPTFACEILVDLLEGANNRVRLQDDLSAAPCSPRLLFDQRWQVFVSTMVIEPPSSPL